MSRSDKACRLPLSPGPFYSAKTDDAPVCPRCISSGLAAKKLQGDFNDCCTTGKVPAGLLRKLTQRTPGPLFFQSPRWPACCGSPCIYYGAVSPSECRRLASRAAKAAGVEKAEEELRAMFADCDEDMDDLAEMLADADPDGDVVLLSWGCPKPSCGRKYHQFDMS